MDGIIDSFPSPFSEYACPRKAQVNFHSKTRSACKDGSAANVGLRVVKSIVIGDLSVGKTSLINRYCRNLFEKDYKPTIGVEFELKKYKILGQEFHMQMWDTSGEERFKSITGAYYRGAHVIIVVFDLEDPRSFNNASNWLEDALEKTRSTTPEVFLVGNKLDIMKEHILEKVREEAIHLSNQLNAEYWEVSAKTGKHVNELFARAASLCFDQAVLRETENTRDSKQQQLGGGGLIKTKNPSQTIVLGKEPEDSSYINKAYNKEKKQSKCCGTS